MTFLSEDLPKQFSVSLTWIFNATSTLLSFGHWTKVLALFPYNNMHHLPTDISTGAMYRVFALQLGPNFGILLEADKNFQFRLTVGKMHAFRSFTEKYLRPYRCKGINFAVMVYLTNPKIKSIELEYKSTLYISALLVTNLFVCS